MSKLEYVTSFRDLLAYRKSRELSLELFALTNNFPKTETYALTDQIRRASRSIGAQIAEAWAKRTYEKHFVSKLTDAEGEQQETQHWIDTARACGCLSPEQAGSLLSKCAEIGRMLGGMLAKAEQFCASSASHTRELQSDYLISPTLDH